MGHKKGRNYKWGICFLLCCMLGIFFCGNSLPVNAENAGESGKRVLPNVYDIRIIPDKYNTGAQGELEQIGLGQQLEQMVLATGNNGTANVLEFYYRNKEVEGTIVLENMDFSAYPLLLFHADMLDRDIHLIFNNCKFSRVSLYQTKTPVFCEFNNCSIQNFSGGNVAFNHCQFGNSYSDGLIPFQDVQVRDCFFMDMTTMVAPGGEIHTDGTQLYGKAGIDVKNVCFDNCRFEIPSVADSTSHAYVNACIMLQMEYSNAKQVSFQNCIVNGGGYTIYARATKGDWTLEDVSFRNIQFGCAALYGKFYSQLSSDVAMEDISNTDSLYIGSVWKDKEGTHFSVTNDTNQKRSLLVDTDKGVFRYEIEACPSGSQIQEYRKGQTDSKDWEKVMNYASMPFDMDIRVPKDCGYAVCYDITTPKQAKQIRFINWTNEVVTRKEEIEELKKQEQVILSGSCGENVQYTLTNTGILTLYGQGRTYDYHSGKLSPWSEYNDRIKEIHVKQGMEHLGNQLFRNCSGVNKLVLEEGVKSTGGYTFGGLSSLTELTLPASMEVVGKAAFSGGILQKVYYLGDSIGKLKIEEQNDNLVNRLIAVTFADIKEDSWQYEYARYAYLFGLMKGKGKDEEGRIIFAPNDNLSREELVQVLYNREGKEEVSYADRFLDVKEGKWYTKAVLWAEKEGIAQGYGNGLFGVGDAITREQAITILYKYARNKGYPLTTEGDLLVFADRGKISPWATEYMRWAVGAGIIKGKGDNVDPLGKATRAECAAIFMKFDLLYPENSTN